MKEENNYGFFTALKKLFEYSKDNKKQYIIGTFFMIAFVITSMIYTTSNSNLIASIMSLKLETAAKLVIICAIWRIISITFCHNQWRKIVIDAEKNIIANIQKKTYQKILSLSMTSFSKMESGKILNTMKAAESGMINTISSLLLESTYVATSFVMLIIIFCIDYKIGIGVTIISVISLYLFKIQLRKSKKYLEKEFDNTEEYITLLGETTRGIKEIKALGFKEKCYSIFSNEISNLSNVRKKRRMLNKTVNTSKWTIRIIGDAIILLYIISKVQTGEFSIETAMLIITYMTTIIDDVFHRIIEHDFGISEFTANMKRITEILENDKLKEEQFGNIDYVNIEGKIELEDVSFQYENSTEGTLYNINLECKKYTRNAIVGLSGAGKSTIFKLLLKEYDNYEGKITFDGHNIKEFTEKSFRNAITIVNQEPVLFNMSIKDNLLMANENATMEEIKEACKLANINEFIEELPNQYEEIINENSNNISVGQKQRIAIARAILRNTPIILFDESTSNLDNYSTNKIRETMEKLSKSKTIISIAHSLDTVKDFDNIIVLQNGRVVEQGSHEELLEREGNYYQLINV